MSNLIDRQKAIDALCSECQGRCIPCKYYPCNEIKAINSLPSAQPEIIRCRDCRKYLRLGCPMGITVIDAPAPDGYCYKAERREDGKTD